MNKAVRIVIRAQIFAICVYTWWEHSKLWADESIPAYANPSKKYGGVFRFLTMCNFFGHIVTNGLMLLGEFIRPVKTLGDIAHYGISFGTTWVVFLIFWILYVINQELIMPARIAVFYPMWMNVVEHGLIVPFAVVNTFLEPRRGSRGAYALTLVCFTAAYVGLIVHIHAVTNEWVYPFLNAVGYTQVIFVVLPLTIALCGTMGYYGVQFNDAYFTRKSKA